MIDLTAKYEDAILERVVTFLSRDVGAEVRATARPDREDRTNQSVEMLAEGCGFRFAIEHTRLNTMESGIADDVLLQKRLVTLAESLDGTVPGWYELEIDARAIIQIPARDWTEASKQIHSWVVAQAPTLDPERDFEEDEKSGHYSTSTTSLVGVPFAVRLHKTSAKRSIVIPKRRMPETTSVERQQMIQKAVDEKCPKLKTAAVDGRESVLVLETRDFQGQSAWLVADGLRVAFAARDDVPDRIYLVETDYERWNLWIIKDSKGWLTDKPRRKDRGPHDAGERP